MEDKIEIAILQNKYKKMHTNNEKLFPNEWYNVKEYELKKKILSECIEKNILIINSSYYYEFREIALNDIR